MTIREYINALEEIAKVEGDAIEVDTWRAERRMTAPRPEVDYRKILNKRESREDFWYDWGDNSRYGGEKNRAQKGTKVVRV